MSEFVFSRAALGRRLAFTRSWSVRIGLVVLGLVLGVAFIGPYFAPYSPSAEPGIPFSTPSATALSPSN